MTYDDDVRYMHDKRLVHGARFRALPMNVRCPARCRFCYESAVEDLFPHVRTHYLPRYDDARFDSFRATSAAARRWEVETGREPIYGFLPTFDITPSGGVAHFPICDAFSAGLSHGQIEELVRLREGDICLLYAVGLGIDPDFVSYLSRAYPDTFRLHLSIVTFDPKFRADLLHPGIDVDALRRVVQVVRGATFFLMLFDEEQLVADVDAVLSTTTPRNGGLFLHKLYYDRRSPGIVVDHARAAMPHRAGAVRRIARMERDSRPVMCSLGADIQAWTRRHDLLPLFDGCTGEADEVVFCSPGAFFTIEHMFSQVDTLVVPMASAFGGDHDLVQGGTVRDVVSQVRALDREVRRVVVPSAMFWIDDGFDLNGDRAEQLRAALPDLEVEVIQIPTEVIVSVVGIQDCVDYLDAGIGA